MPVGKVPGPVSSEDIAFDFPAMAPIIEDVEEALTRLKTSSAKVRHLEYAIAKLQGIIQDARNAYSIRQNSTNPIVEPDPIFQTLDAYESRVRELLIRREALLMFADERQPEAGTLREDQIPASRPTNSPFMLLAEVAEYARCSESSVRNALRDGLLNASYIGNSPRFTREDVHDWMKGKVES